MSDELREELKAAISEFNEVAARVPLSVKMVACMRVKGDKWNLELQATEEL